MASALKRPSTSPSGWQGLVEGVAERMVASTTSQDTGVASGCSTCRRGTSPATHRYGVAHGPQVEALAPATHSAAAAPAPRELQPRRTRRASARRPEPAPRKPSPPRKRRLRRRVQAPPLSRAGRRGLVGQRRLPGSPCSAASCGLHCPAVNCVPCTMHGWCIRCVHESPRPALSSYRLYRRSALRRASPQADGGGQTGQLGVRCSSVSPWPLARSSPSRTRSAACCLRMPGGSKRYFASRRTISSPPTFSISAIAHRAKKRVHSSRHTSMGNQRGYRADPRSWTPRRR